jgi:hypothetical protein
MNHSNFSTDHSDDAGFMQALVLDYERNQRKITPRETVLQILVLVQYFIVFPILAFCLFWVRKWMNKQGLFLSSRELEAFVENGSSRADPPQSSQPKIMLS